MNDELSIRVTTEQGRIPITILHITGDIDGRTYEQLQDQADKVIESGARDMILDLSQVPYVSSAGIRAINHIFKKLRSFAPAESGQSVGRDILEGSFKASHLKLANLSAEVSNVLKMTGVDMYVEIHRSLKEAIASF